MDLAGTVWGALAIKKLSIEYSVTPAYILSLIDEKDEPNLNDIRKLLHL